jgi:predicted RNase H-like HicB family nuclease
MKMSEMKFRIHCWEGEDGYLVGQCVELPAAITQGKDKQELLENMKEAITLVLQDMEREFQETHPQLTIEKTEIITVDA